MSDPGCSNSSRNSRAAPWTKGRQLGGTLETACHNGETFGLSLRGSWVAGNRLSSRYAYAGPVRARRTAAETAAENRQREGLRIVVDLIGRRRSGFCAKVIPIAIRIMITSVKNTQP